MREDFYNETEKEEAKKKQTDELKVQKKKEKDEAAKIEKILKEEEQKNFRINKKYNKIASKLEEQEQEAQNTNRLIEDMKDKNYHNYYDQNFTEKLEKKVNEVFRDHFAEFEENINNTAITEENEEKDLRIIFEYQSNTVPLPLEGRHQFLELKQLIGSYFFLSQDLIYFKDAGGSLLIPTLAIKETLFSDYYYYFKNYVPKVNVVLRNDLKFDDVIKENLEHVNSEIFLDEQSMLKSNEKKTSKKQSTNNFLDIDVMDQVNKMTDALKKKKKGFENIYKLALNCFFLMVIIFYSLKKIDSQNLLESVAVSDSITSYFEIIYQTRLDEIDYSQLNSISQTYSAKLNFIMNTLTEELYRQGYAPFKRGLIFQKRAKNVSCLFNDQLKYDYRLCVDPQIEDKNIIHDDGSHPQNLYRTLYGFTGYLMEAKIEMTSNSSDIVGDANNTTFTIDLPPSWLDFQTSSVKYIINYMNPYNDFIITFILDTQILFPAFNLTYFSLTKHLYLSNITPATQQIIFYGKINLIFTILLFIFMWFEVFMILTENSQNDYILRYKYEKEKTLVEPENKEEEINNTTYHWIYETKIRQKPIYFVFIFPGFFWFTTVGSLIYIKIRNDIFDNFQTTLSNIDIDSDNYQDLLSLFIQRYDIYANTDGIITIIAFFSFIRYISRVSGLLNCYFEMIVQFAKNTSAIALIIFTFISFTSIIFMFHALGALGTDYNNYLNNFLLFLALMEKNGFWSSAKYDSIQDATKLGLLNSFLTAVIFFFAVFLSSFLIFAILVSINTQYVHDTKISLEKERYDIITRRNKLLKLARKKGRKRKTIKS